MTVPSYDDLTPGIPDIVDSESVSQLALFMRQDLNRRSGGQEKSGKKTNQDSPDLLTSCKYVTLYACLRNTANGELPTASGEVPTANCELLRIARDFSPRIMRVSDSEVLLDVSGLGRLIGEPPEIARQLARAMYDTGLTASVALAPTQTAARLIAASPGAEDPGLRVAGFADFHISDLPVSLLQPLETLPPAMNDRDRARPYDTRDAQRLYETLAKWGIATLGALAALPIAELSSRLGRRGVALHRLARGLDPKPFVPDADTPRFIGRLELEWPIEALEPLSFVFARLLEPLSLSLERADRGAAAIRLELRLTDRSTHARVLQLPAPMRDARVLRTLLLLDLESNPPRTAVDIVTIELDPAPARITQFSLLQRALPSPETLSTLTARLAALLGESRIGSPALLDSHRPDAFEMARFAPETRAISSRRSDEVAKADAMTGFAPMSMPDLKVGPTGDGPTGDGLTGDGPTGESVLRRQRHPPAIRVSVEHGRPVYLAASRRGMPQGAVVQAAGPWRTSGGWWGLAPNQPPPRLRRSAEALRAKAEGGSHEICPWSRDEWDVALSSGVVCRIYQDRTTERWFLDGTYD